MAESDAGLAKVVGGHFDVDLVADADADEVFAHLSGDMGEDFVAIGQSDAEHGSGQDLGHRTGHFNWFFFGHAAVYVYNKRGSEGKLKVVSGKEAKRLVTSLLSWRKAI